jgi:hypothetical protein
MGLEFGKEIAIAQACLESLEEFRLLAAAAAVAVFMGQKRRTGVAAFSDDVLHGGCAVEETQEGFVDLDRSYG